VLIYISFSLEIKFLRLSINKLILNLESKIYTYVETEICYY